MRDDEAAQVRGSEGSGVSSVDGHTSGDLIGFLQVQRHLTTDGRITRSTFMLNSCKNIKQVNVSGFI